MTRYATARASECSHESRRFTDMAIVIICPIAIA